MYSGGTPATAVTAVVSVTVPVVLQLHCVAVVQQVQQCTVAVL